MSQWSNAKLCDIGNLVLGAVLLCCPWLFSYRMGVESQNAVVSGIVIVGLSVAALAAFAVWEEWLNLVVGLWLIAAPWVLKFPTTKAMRVDVVVGILVAVLAAIELVSRQRWPNAIEAYWEPWSE